jgi:histidinol-phosphatase (PHP family)
MNILECTKKHSMTIEINTSGLRKDINETYPNLNILPYLEKFNIPITFGSDAHKPEQVGYQFAGMEKIVSNYPNITFATINEGILK